MGELYGREPVIITRAIARITYELMIEQSRQEEKAMEEAKGGYVNSDLELMIGDSEVYQYLKYGGIRVRF